MHIILAETHQMAIKQDKAYWHVILDFLDQAVLSSSTIFGFPVWLNECHNMRQLTLTTSRKRKTSRLPNTKTMAPPQQPHQIVMTTLSYHSFVEPFISP